MSYDDALHDSALNSFLKKVFGEFWDHEEFFNVCS